MRSFQTLFIGGRWVAPATGDTIQVISPFTEELLATVPSAGPEDIDRAVRAARSAFDGSGWRDAPLEERLGVLERFADEYSARLEEINQIVSEENGGAITQGRMANPSAVYVLRYFIDTARTYDWVEKRVGLAGQHAAVIHEPVGVVGAIVPWNSPPFLTMAKLAPALAGGSTVIVKPAPETPVDALVLAEAAEAAGMPEGVLSVLPAGRDASEALVAHPGIDKISFTGSTATGRRMGPSAVSR